MDASIGERKPKLAVREFPPEPIRAPGHRKFGLRYDGGVQPEDQFGQWCLI
jgi:hypothetical protein